MILQITLFTFNQEGAYVVGILVGIILLIYLIRMFGAWLLRIDDVIKQQKKGNELLSQVLEELLSKNDSV